jgi:hypothetical protein
MNRKITTADTATAFSDIQHRAWLLSKSIWEWFGMISGQTQMAPDNNGSDLEQQRFNSEADRALENVLLNAKQWYKTLDNSALPKELRRGIKPHLNKEIKTTVERLRDIREHWEQTRKYFIDPTIPVPPEQSNVMWFKKKFPNGHPWSSGLIVGFGYFIGGPEVLNLHNLLEQVDGINKLVEQYKP